MWINRRLEVTGLDLKGDWKPAIGHGGDEFGNCSVYLRTPLFGIVVFPFPHLQLKVEVPEPGTHPWIDAMWWQDVPPMPAREEEGKP